MTSVLLIDDDAELTNLLKEYLEQEGFAVSVANDGDRALGRIMDARADIVVLDIMMPSVNGLDVLRRIREESTIPVLMLSARGDEADRILGLDLGADDYLAKPCSPRELAARIKAVLRRSEMASQAPPPDALSEGPLRLDPARRLATWNGTPLSLTGIEFAVLQTLVERKGAAVSRDDISQQALGRPLAPYDRAIDVHISAIRAKLGTYADGRGPIQNVRGVGYQLVRA